MSDKELIKKGDQWFEVMNWETFPFQKQTWEAYLNGKHGVEGAYVAAKIDGKLVGAPDRAVSFPSNTWEYVNARRDKNYTYYIPLKKEYVNKEIEIFVLS